MSATSSKLKKLLANGKANLKAATDKVAGASGIGHTRSKGESSEQWNSMASPGLQKSITMFRGKDDGDFGSKFTVGRELGKGSYGSVKVVKCKETGVEYACKFVELENELEKTNNLEAAVKESEILMHVRGHPNILKVHSFFEDGKCLYIIQELCPGGDLSAAVLTTIMTETVIQKVMHRILDAVRHCHALGVIHRDIKLDNFLVSKDGKDLGDNIRLADFGCSEFTSDGALLSDPVGTLEYMAPEVFDGMYSYPADLWSCGVVMYTMISGRFPFTIHRGDHNKTADSIASCTLDVESGIWKGVSEDAKEVVRVLLEKDPEARRTAAQVLEMKWFNSHEARRDIPIERPVRMRIKEFAAMPRFKQEVLRLVAMLMTDESTKGFRMMFEAAGGGERIPLDVALGSLRAKGMPESEIDMVKVHFRLDDEGFLPLKEYIAMVAASTAGVKLHGVLEEVYLMFDPEHSGFITVQGTKDAFHISDVEEVAQVLAEAGAKEGRLSEEAFYKLMTGGGKPSEMQTGERRSPREPRIFTKPDGCSIM